jgi:hypothetical protein
MEGEGGYRERVVFIPGEKTLQEAAQKDSRWEKHPRITDTRVDPIFLTSEA